MADDLLTALAKVQPSEAIRFIRQRETIPTERWGQLEAEAHARAFTSAGITNVKMLGSVHEAMSRAMSEGTGFGAFRERFAKLADQYGWTPRGPHGTTGSVAQRALLIYETNIATAFSAGQWARLQTPEAVEMYPWFRYRHHSCPHPRLQHVAWDGLILPRDDPFWATHWPPNGWRCHCTVEAVSRRAMRRNEWSVSESPKIEWVEKRNPATGEMVRVPAGIDLGFAYNPGMVWQREEAARATRAVRPLESVGGIPKNAVPPEVLHQAQAEQIGQLLEVRAGTAEAGTLPAHARDLLGREEAAEAQADGNGGWDGSVTLTADTLGKNRLHHAELGADEYRRLPELLAEPVAITPQSANASGKGIGVVGRWGKQLYLAIVRRQPRVPAATLMSFHALSDAEARRLARRGFLWGGMEDGTRE
ncbi:MAG: phage minor head protein [Gluconacetobacter sp.]